MDCVLAQMDQGSRWLWLLNELDRAAESRKVYGIVPTRVDLVGSENTVCALVQHYLYAQEGKTYICQGVSGCGKTTSALYLLHGDFNFRPPRAIMIRANDSKDLATSFSQNLGAPGAARAIPHLLARALTPKDKRESQVKVGWNSYFDWAAAKLRQLHCHTNTFETELLRIRKQELKLETTMRSGNPDLPLLIIDGLVKSEANSNFVGALYEAIDDSHATALILMKDETWANELIGLNGGVKILPVQQAISNPKTAKELPFTDVPRWKGMGWKEEDLQAFAEMVDVTGVDIADGMTPQKVLDMYHEVSLKKVVVESGKDGDYL